jgi:hypothetical protein
MIVDSSPIVIPHKTTQKLAAFGNGNGFRSRIMRSHISVEIEPSTIYRQHNGGEKNQ